LHDTFHAITPSYIADIRNGTHQSKEIEKRKRRGVKEQATEIGYAA
jgi:hypothetical protein